MQLVQRWWNGRYGRLARRDIWLEEHTVWRVRVRQGDGDSPTQAWTFDTRPEADALVQRLLSADPAGGWRDITSLTATQPANEGARAAGPNTARAHRTDTGPGSPRPSTPG